ncbi:unnamed protein product [Amoebophrya sp. A120]|nr:unnamed protein product [Amoebophrya sp. A120]|eukprot:GSA120T00004485001.1
MASPTRTTSATVSASPITTAGSPSFLSDVSPQTFAIANAASFALCLFFNYGAGRKLFSDLSIGEVSELYTVLLSPKGWAFAIWGIIYLGLIAFCVWQFWAVVVPNKSNDGRGSAGGLLGSSSSTEREWRSRGGGDDMFNGNERGPSSSQQGATAVEGLPANYLATDSTRGTITHGPGASAPVTPPDDERAATNDADITPTPSSQKSSVEYYHRLLCDQIGWLFTLCNFLNATWICLWCQGRPVVWIWLSALALLSLVACLAVISVRVRMFRRFIDSSDAEEESESAMPSLFGAGSRRFITNYTGRGKNSTNPFPSSAVGVEDEELGMQARNSGTDTEHQHQEAAQFGEDATARRRTPVREHEERSGRVAASSHSIASNGGIQSDSRGKNAKSGRAPSLFRPPLYELLVLDIPFSIYFGWTTAAAIINVSCATIGSDALLSTTKDEDHDNSVELSSSSSPLTIAPSSAATQGNNNYGKITLCVLGIPQHIWAIIMLLIAAGIYMAVLVRTKNLVYPFVFFWAVWAIAEELRVKKGAEVRSFEGSSVAPSDAEAVEVTARVLSILVLLFGVVGVAWFVRKVGSDGR